MERGFKYRIYPNASQRDQIARTLGCCRFVYNRALDVKKSAYAKTGKTVSWAELSRMLPAWKRDSETSWLAQADSMVLQQSVRDLDRAYKNFFRRVREGGKPGFPKFKSRRHARQSYRTNGGKVLDRNHIALPKLVSTTGSVKNQKMLDLPGYGAVLAAVPDISKCNERDILQAIGFTQKGDRSLKEKAAIGREGSKQLEAARNREGLENFDGRDFR